MITGYVSGVFDMFHIGHLNIIMQARRNCDRLIVGAVTDEVVEQVKGRRPIVPLDERMRILAGLRDVDDVVVDTHSDKFDTWIELKYDVIFKGDDWQGTPKGRKLEQDLAAVGAHVHYFPYTQHTSSSMLRAVVSELAHTEVRPLPNEPDLAATGAGPDLDTDRDAELDSAAGTCSQCGRMLVPQPASPRG